MLRWLSGSPASVEFKWEGERWVVDDHLWLAVQYPLGSRRITLLQQLLHKSDLVELPSLQQQAQSNSADSSAYTGLTMGTERGGQAERGSGVACT